MVVIQFVGFKECSSKESKLKFLNTVLAKINGPINYILNIYEIFDADSKLTIYGTRPYQVRARPLTPKFLSFGLISRPILWFILWFILDILATN